MYVRSSEIATARDMDLLTYLRCYDPGELVRLSSNVFTTKTHDSLKISNGKWYWWSRSTGGKSALDYLVVVKGMRLQEAVRHINGLSGNIIAVPKPINKKHIEKQEVFMPKKSETNVVVKEYLQSRGISDEVIEFCIEKGFIYESNNHRDVVFVGYDEKRKVRHACYRACDDSRKMGDCKGSDKEYSFRLGKGVGDTLHVFEGAIDLLSYVTLVMNEDNDWTKFNLLSLDGVALAKNGKVAIPKALDNYLRGNPNIKKICLHLDNDEAGRNAAYIIQGELCRSFDVRLLFPPAGKDYNEYLQIKRGKEREDGERRNTESASCKARADR